MYMDKTERIKKKTYEKMVKNWEKLRKNVQKQILLGVRSHKSSKSYKRHWMGEIKESDRNQN